MTRLCFRLPAPIRLTCMNQCAPVCKCGLIRQGMGLALTFAVARAEYATLKAASSRIETLHRVRLEEQGQIELFAAEVEFAFINREPLAMAVMLADEVRK